MKLATARQRIGAIRRAAKSGDSETAHRLEDAFRADVLTAIANLETDRHSSVCSDNARNPKSQQRFVLGAEIFWPPLSLCAHADCFG